MRAQLGRLLRHSAIYGLASLASRIASFLLLPVISPRVHADGYGRIELLVGLVALLVPILRSGVATGFFRFYYERELAPDASLVIRTVFWFTTGGAVLGAVVGTALAAPISRALLGDSAHADLVRVAFLLLLVQMLYEQLTSLYRVEERSVAFAVAALANLAITVATSLALVVAAHMGALGAMLGNAAGTTIVLAWLLWDRRRELRPAWDRDLIRAMNRFGLPLLPAGLALWLVDFSDRYLLAQFRTTHDVGVYAVGVKLASAMILVQLAFRTAWPAFAYSITDDAEARRAFSFVLTYIAFVGGWVSLTLGLVAPWLVPLVTDQTFAAAGAIVGPLAFAGALLTAYTMLAIVIARSNRTGRTWLIASAGAALNVAANLVLIPRYGILGASVATVAASLVLVAATVWSGQRIYPVAYQWRRVGLATITAVALYAIGRAIAAPLAGQLALALSYPLVLLGLGFYLPVERRWITAIPRQLRR